MLALFSLSDRLCAHRWSFEIGHQVGELGWRLRQPGQRWKAQADAEAWGGRGPSASYAEWLAEGRGEGGTDPVAG